MRLLPDANGQAVYEARLNLDFKPKPGVDLTAFDQRLSSCLHQVNSKEALKGPSGEVTTLKIDDQTVPPRAVDVRNTGRANYTSWVQSFPCATMTHKILHHLGLCDHHREMADVGENLESDSGSRSAADRQK